MMRIVGKPKLRLFVNIMCQRVRQQRRARLRRQLRPVQRPAAVNGLHGHRLGVVATHVELLGRLVTPGRV